MPPPPVQEPVDDRPHWQKVIDSQEPGALSGRRRDQPSGAARPAPKDEPEPKPEEAAKTKAGAAAAAPAPTGKGRTYCSWQYYAKIHYLCTDLEPEQAKQLCEAQQTAALGEPIVCLCRPAEGYAPQCL
jgi:hypothetical protein